ncbi:MAG: TerC family protein, partial [Actinomycetota bacterium]|nr:TerC family protein [Actinomycetota bacterium]
MDTSLLVWAITIGAIVLLILVDFFTVTRKPHEVMFREGMLWSIFYIAVAIAFGVIVWNWAGADFGTQYFTAYLVEKSLS